MAEKPFKVIVSGAGPVGLTLAHALSKAGVDYVILEGRDEVVIDIGATIILNQATLRVLGQLGLLEKVKEAGVGFTEGCFRSATSNGRFGTVSLQKQFEE
jgi:2-polyprenyl-6-methoxyphenol hydroxylase-like FAD-dependent oxidoreductase